MTPMPMPRPTDEAKEAFRALVPPGGDVTLRPMFGNLAAFVNGNMFAGLFGDDLFVRVGDADRGALMGKGGRDFEPMPGRAMKGYVVIPGDWRRDTKGTRSWISRTLEATSAMPAKAAKPKARKRTTFLAT